MDNGLQVTIKDLNGTSTAKIVLDKQSVSNALGRSNPYQSLPSKFMPALEQIGDYVRTTMIPRVFQQEGPGWASLAKMTQRDRATKGFNPQHPILIRTRDLFQELTEKSHPQHIEIIKTGTRSRIEIGGSSAKFVQNQLGRGATGQRLPKRAMIPGTGGIPILDSDKEQMRRILIDALMAERVA